MNWFKFGGQKSKTKHYACECLEEKSLQMLHECVGDPQINGLDFSWSRSLSQAFSRDSRISTLITKRLCRLCSICVWRIHLFKCVTSLEQHLPSRPVCNSNIKAHFHFYEDDLDLDSRFFLMDSKPLGNGALFDVLASNFIKIKSRTE